jgi:hypothetical protein
MSTTPTSIVALQAALTRRGMSYPEGSVVNGAFVASGQVGIITADAVLTERHHDESEITEHPVEQGSVISDHIFNRPAHLDLTYAWAPGSQYNTSQDPGFLNTLYGQMLQLKANATLFRVVTGKRTYENMAIKSLGVVTDKETENVLDLTIELVEILMALTSSSTISAMSQQSLPQKTAPTVPQGQVNLQPGTNFNGGAE